MINTERHRFADTADRLIVLGVVLLVGLAACAALDGGSNAPTTDVAQRAPVTIATVVTSAPPTTESTTTTTTTAPTTTVAPTTTIAPAVAVVSKVCESLRHDGFETRRMMFDALAGAFESAGGDGDGRAEVEAECGDEVDRLTDAVEIRDRMQAIDIAEEDDSFAMSFADFSCGAGTFEVTVTNDSAATLGLHANFAMYRDRDQEEAVQSSMSPIVIWSLAPGATEVVTGRFTDTPEQISCNFEAQVFDADPSAADASLSADAEHPSLTGDDPSEWFPELLAFERAARTSGDIDLAAVTEDVRSMSYDEVALAISEGVALPEVELLEVCERGRSQPDADHIGFVYLERLENGRNRLSHGLFRRGADGQWRSLSTPRYYESPLGSDCFTVDPE